MNLRPLRDRIVVRRLEGGEETVMAGDVILFGKYATQEIRLDGEDSLVMREDEVRVIE